MTHALNLPIESPEAARAEIASSSAQAKVDAVASLTMKAYDKASSLVLTDDEIKKLQEDFGDEAFKTGANGKEDLIYIEHAFLRERLNNVFGPGQWAIIPRNRWAEDFKTGNGKDASRIYVEAMLCVRGCFVAEAVGDMVYYKNNDSQNYGDAVEGAKSACLRRCAKELGIGLQAWKKEFCEGWKQRNKGASHRNATQQAAEKVEYVKTSWRMTVIHFGKQKGSKLVDLPPKSLQWWQTEWQPKRSREDDPQSWLLRDALDESMKPNDEAPVHWKEVVVHCGGSEGKKLGDLTHGERVAVYNGFNPKLNQSVKVEDIRLKKALVEWKAEAEKEML